MEFSSDLFLFYDLCFISSQRELTDREFEKMLAEEEKQKTQRRSKSKKDDRGSKSHSRNEKRSVHHDSDSHESGDEGGKEVVIRTIQAY